MKKVVLLGDSIRLIGYGTVIKNYLKPCELYQPEENTRFSQYLLRMVFELQEQLKNSDIIHFNAGLWDTCDLFNEGEPFTSIPDYVKNMVRVAKILSRYGKRLIYSTITPIKPIQEHNTNERIKAFNDAVVPELLKMGVEVIDLYSLIEEDIENNICDEDHVHLTNAAIEKAAKLIADKINESL